MKTCFSKIGVLLSNLSCLPNLLEREKQKTKHINRCIAKKSTEIFKMISDKNQYYVKHVPSIYLFKTCTLYLSFTQATTMVP